MAATFMYLTDISWEEFEENQKRLDSNRTNTERCGPAREGAYTVDHEYQFIL